MAEYVKLRLSVDELDAELDRISIRGKNKRRAWGITVVFVILLAVSGYLTTSYFAFYRVTGSSMERTLSVGETVVCQKNAEIVRGSIVAFERDDVLLIKRVIAMAGDEVSIGEGGEITINGIAISEPYLAGSGTREGDVAFPLTVPSGQLFVMGDNRVVSIDSRDSSVGMVSRDEIIGCAIATIWPIQSFALIKNGTGVAAR
jgi:signal peptidase I